MQARERVVRHGQGKTAREERLRAELVGIESLRTYENSGEPEQTRVTPSGATPKGQAIHAVVVGRWDNRRPKGEGTLYLTTGPVGEPFVVFDTSDWRSVIENGLFKEGKSPWHLGRFPKKSEAAVIVPGHFPLLVMALCPAFGLWQAQEATALLAQREVPAPVSRALLAAEGTARWRGRLKEENGHKVIVFVADVYGIFHLAERAVLSGLRLQRLPSQLGSRQAILERYGICP